MPAISRMLKHARILLVLPLLVSGLVVTTQFVAPPEADAASAYTKKVVKRKIADGYRIARKQVGDPYRAGGDGPSSFDCSGLVQYSFKKAGFNVPRTTDQQAKYARKISKRWMRPGDLIFFHNSGDVYHVGIYTGKVDGKVVVLHSPRTGQDVKREKVWTSSWFPATLRAS
ncbi:MAG TPA: C40 family peptidase [Nocardioides sp.]